MDSTTLFRHRLYAPDSPRPRHHGAYRKPDRNDKLIEKKNILQSNFRIFVFVTKIIKIQNFKTNMNAGSWWLFNGWCRGHAAAVNLGRHCLYHRGIGCIKNTCFIMTSNGKTQLKPRKSQTMNKISWKLHWKLWTSNKWISVVRKSENPFDGN